MESRQERPSKDHSFRDCVQDCARDERMIAAYNELYETPLSASVLAMLQHGEEQSSPNPESPEALELARFIFFCYDTVWRHVSRTRQHPLSPHFRLTEPTTAQPKELSGTVPPADQKSIGSD